MTVTSKLPANAERNKEIEKIQEREEKAASFGGAVEALSQKTFFFSNERYFTDQTRQ